MKGARRPKVPKIKKVDGGFIEWADQAKISLLSQDNVRLRSSGEIKIGQTIDIKTQRPVERGLLCEKIFGPIDLGMCNCRRTKSMKDAGWHMQFPKDAVPHGVECPFCGTEAGNPKVRRYRMGHVELAVPVVHPWFRGILASILGIPPRKFDSLVMCESYFIDHAGDSQFAKGDIISAAEFFDYLQKHPQDRRFGGLNGGPLVKRMLRRLDLDALWNKLKKEKETPALCRRLMLVRDIRKSGIKLDWLVLDALPVLPADLRPLFFMEDGTMVDSDLNELYAKVINRSLRLKRMAALAGPENVVNGARRGLQMAVDGLMAKGSEIKNRGGTRFLKPLEALIESKYGRLRRNLLGKRVDYSGRSVIVAGPWLKLYQCGLPVDIAMELFKPFVLGNLKRSGMASSLKHGLILCNLRDSAAMDALDEEMRERVVMLNRAPSLHRMSFQAFYPVLVEGKAIVLHPMVCGAFNADFDGDQMGVHLPITVEAQVEAQMLMLSLNNILSPASGKLVTAPSQDIVLGIYFLTKDLSIGGKGAGMVFSDADDAVCAYDHGVVDLNSKVRVRVEGKLVESTPGRCLFWNLFPSGVAFDEVNKTMKKKDLNKLLESCFKRFGRMTTARLLDSVKETGYRFATISGISFGMGDITVPKSKGALLEEAEKKVAEIKMLFSDGGLIEEERYNKVLEAWTEAGDKLIKDMMENFGVSDPDLPQEEKTLLKEWNSLFMMADSGARGSVDQISQLAGMRGLMAKPTGEIVEIPIKHNLLEGLSYFEYLLACHGARKGRADGALKTANAGYFTRRLVDVAHSVIVNAEDCGCRDGFAIGDLKDKGLVIQGFEERVVGRVSSVDVRNPENGAVIVKRGDVFNQDLASKVRSAGLDEVNVRSPVRCTLPHGICGMCYGMDLSSGRFPELGEPVGIIAAQSIGEPGTQLTLRTFHSGGKASGGGEQTTLVAPADGILVFEGVSFVEGRGGNSVVVNKKGRILIRRGSLLKEVAKVRYGSTLFAVDGQQVSRGDVLASWDGFSFPVVSANGGKGSLKGMAKGSTVREEMDFSSGKMRMTVTGILPGIVPTVVVEDREYAIPVGALVLVKEGDEVFPGDVLAKVPKEAQKNVDITMGLTRVLDVLEVRKGRMYATMVEIDGEVKIGKMGEDSVLVSVENEFGDVREYKVPVGVQLNFQSGDQVSAGDVFFDGMLSVEDVLKVHGSEAAGRFVVDEVQKVYKAQGVEINDKHLEIMVRRMMERVLITCGGDSEFVAGELVPVDVFLATNELVVGKKATARRAILGLAKAARLCDSWLSAASFERTGGVLAESALRCTVDMLRGAKENVIVGNLVPLGTGHVAYRNIKLKNSGPTREEKRSIEARKRFNALFKSEPV